MSCLIFEQHKHLICAHFSFAVINDSVNIMTVFPRFYKASEDLEGKIDCINCQTESVPCRSGSFTNTIVNSSDISKVVC